MSKTSFKCGLCGHTATEFTRCCPACKKPTTWIEEFDDEPLTPCLKSMTYQELILALNKLTPEQLQCDVTIVGPDGEYHSASLYFEAEDDVLDKDHPFLGAINSP